MQVCCKSQSRFVLTRLFDTTVSVDCQHFWTCNMPMVCLEVLCLFSKWTSYVCGAHCSGNTPWRIMASVQIGKDRMLLRKQRVCTCWTYHYVRFDLALDLTTAMGPFTKQLYARWCKEMLDWVVSGGTGVNVQWLEHSLCPLPTAYGETFAVKPMSVTISVK